MTYRPYRPSIDRTRDVCHTPQGTYATPQISRRKLLLMVENLRNSRRFSPSKVSRYTVSSRFTSQYIVSSMSIFNPRKTCKCRLSFVSSYGDSSIDTLIQHYGENWEADGEEYLKKALSHVSSTLNGKPFTSSFLSTQRKI